MLMSAMVKLDVHSFRNRFLWEILGNAQYLTSSQGHCVIPSNISFWSKRRSQLSQRVNLERAQGRETQMGKSSDPQHLWETDEGGHGDFSQKAGVFRVAISILSTMAAKFHFPPLMGKAKENYETRWELDIWGSHVYKFSCGEKDGGGEGSYCHCKEELLYWRLVVGYPIGDFLNIRKNRNLAGRMWVWRLYWSRFFSRKRRRPREMDWF